MIHQVKSVKVKSNLPEGRYTGFWEGSQVTVEIKSITYYLESQTTTNTRTEVRVLSYDGLVIFSIPQHNVISVEPE